MNMCLHPGRVSPTSKKRSSAGFGGVVGVEDEGGVVVAVVGRGGCCGVVRAGGASALARGWVVMLNGGGGIVAQPIVGEQLEDMVVTVGAVDGARRAALSLWRNSGDGEVGSVLERFYARWLVEKCGVRPSPGNVRKEFARLNYWT
jgi:hypothetical protein